ncbi:hypothetical protein CBR_g40105 [Chara braunii]|uniref:Uncharacterized protein n=1 Tax=Chara braunii TaxID=69332 RepID=A0A388LTA2_CHABU|nr:hypothetical protein CBR_g40105 [Chara braunii]|eukprot:GBG85463.1 hypothetical protein CBR_g40105 [Chara braunii]
MALPFFQLRENWQVIVMAMGNRHHESRPFQRHQGNSQGNSSSTKDKALHLIEKRVRYRKPGSEKDKASGVLDEDHSRNKNALNRGLRYLRAIQAVNDVIVDPSPRPLEPDQPQLPAQHSQEWRVGGVQSDIMMEKGKAFDTETMGPSCTGLLGKPRIMPFGGPATGPTRSPAEVKDDISVSSPVKGKDSPPGSLATRVSNVNVECEGLPVTFPPLCQAMGQVHDLTCCDELEYHQDPSLGASVDAAPWCPVSLSSSSLGEDLVVVGYPLNFHEAQMQRIQFNKPYFCTPSSFSSFTLSSSSSTTTSSLSSSASLSSSSSSSSSSSWSPSTLFLSPSSASSSLSPLWLSPLLSSSLSSSSSSSSSSLLTPSSFSSSALSSSPSSLSLPSPLLLPSSGEETPSIMWQARSHGGQNEGELEQEPSSSSSLSSSPPPPSSSSSSSSSSLGTFGMSSLSLNEWPRLSVVEHCLGQGDIDQVFPFLNAHHDCISESKSINYFDVMKNPNPFSASVDFDLDLVKSLHECSAGVDFDHVPNWGRCSESVDFDLGENWRQCSDVSSMAAVSTLAESSTEVGRDQRGEQQRGAKRRVKRWVDCASETERCEAGRRKLRPSGDNEDNNDGDGDGDDNDDGNATVSRIMMPSSSLSETDFPLSMAATDTCSEFESGDFLVCGQEPSELERITAADRFGDMKFVIHNYSRSCNRHAEDEVSELIHSLVVGGVNWKEEDGSHMNDDNPFSNSDQGVRFDGYRLYDDRLGGYSREDGIGCEEDAPRPWELQIDNELRKQIEDINVLGNLGT